MTEYVMSSTLTKWWCIELRLFLAAIILLNGSVHAQVIQPLRFEMPLSSTDKHFDVISADEDGLYLSKKFLGSQEDQIQVIKLDTALQQLWSGFISVERNYLLVGKKAYKGNLYLLLRYKDFSRNDLILLKVDANANYYRYPIKGYIPFAPGDFQITDKAVLIGGYYNRVPLVLYFSMIDLKSRVLPGLFNETGELTQIRTYPDASFDVLISAMNYNRQRTMWIKNYGPDGELNTNFTLNTEGNKHLIFGRSIKTNNNTQIVAGVYGTKGAEFSHGIFVAQIDVQGNQHIRYYHFADLDNFFKYMKAKREQRVKSRIERRKIQGKKIRLNYRFLVHELVPYKDQFVLLGEAFYPKYITVDRGVGGFNYSNSFIQNGRIFDGYYYTHAVVMGFKPNGDLLWDNSFEINDARTFNLEQFVKLEIQEDRIALMYLYDNNIRTKIIQNDQVLEGKTADPIRTGNPDDIIRKNSSEVSKLEYWYQDYLYAYGVQTLEKSKGQNKRRVFYINKIRHVK
jgi:hypothetical protein